MDGGHLIAETLRSAGVKVVFTLCGGHVMNIYDGCLDRGIKVVDVRHEQAAAMAADGWARVTGEPGVALVTAGPGVTNAVTGLENARRCDSPVVVLGGQGPLEHIDKGALQESDHLSFVRGVTKWSRRVHHTARLGEYVARAFREATSLPGGPAFLELPWDVLFGEVRDTAAPPVPTRSVATAPDPSAVRQAVTWLAAAEHPVVIAGSGIRWGAAARALAEFGRAAGVPVYTNALARGAMPPGHPCGFSNSRGAAFKKADLVLDLYAPWDFRLGYGERLAGGARVVHVAEAPERVGVNRPADLGLAGHPALVLEALLAEAKRQGLPERGAWRDELQALETAKRDELLATADAPADGVNAMRLIRTLAPYLDDDTVFVGDGGNIVATAAKLLQPTRPENWLDTGPFGCLGVGPPFALAAGLARPADRVLVLEGDGSFGLNGFEVETMVRFGVPAVVVVANDGAWSQIRVPQAMMYGSDRVPATGLARTVRYDLVAEGMGARGFHVTGADTLEDTLEAAFRTGRTCVVNVEVDPATNQGTGSSPY